MKIIIRVLIWILVFPCAATLSGCSMQYKFLYFPGGERPSGKVLAARGLEFWPSEAGYRGLIGTPVPERIRGTFIVFHGNGGTAADRDFYPRMLGALGFRTILAEYPRYAGRQGSLGEESFVEDALETIRTASRTYGGDIYLLGESLGCAVAAAAASRTGERVSGMILITPWDTLLAVARAKFPWFPVSLFMKDKYDSVGNLQAFRGRIAVVGAQDDDIIPIRHAAGLYSSLPGPKRMWTLKGAGHNDWLLYLDRDTWRSIVEYVVKERN